MNYYCPVKTVSCKSVRNAQETRRIIYVGVFFSAILLRPFVVPIQYETLANLAAKMRRNLWTESIEKSGCRQVRGSRRIYNDRQSPGIGLGVDCSLPANISGSIPLDWQG